MKNTRVSIPIVEMKFAKLEIENCKSTKAGNGHNLQSITTSEARPARLSIGRIDRINQKNMKKEKSELCESSNKRICAGNLDRKVKHTSKSAEEIVQQERETSQEEKRIWKGSERPQTHRYTKRQMMPR